MKNIFVLLIALLSIQANCQDKTIIKGRIKNFHFSKLSIQNEEDPITGTRDEFFAQISDSGKFVIEAEIHAPQFFSLYMNNRIIVHQIIICPNSQTILNIDSLSYKPSEMRTKWADAIFENYINKRTTLYFDKELKKDSLQKIIHYVLAMQKDNGAALNELRKQYNLNDCHSNYAKGVLDYYDYLMIWTEVNKYPYNDEIYKFMNWLPLNDTNSLQSLQYQRALLVFITHKVYVENGWADITSYDHSKDEYQVKFHNKVLSEIKNAKVRNVILTRQACDLLHIGSTAAEMIYTKYLKNCSDPNFKLITSKYYQEYLKNKNIPKPKIDTLKQPLFEKLKAFKGKVLYLDFWASWCGPCQYGLRFTKDIQKKYAKAPFEVVYVNVQDNLGTFETIVKKLDMKGPIFYLDKKESEAIFKLLGFHGIPQYILIDKNGVLVEKEAPHPDSKLVYEKIDALLKE